MTYSSSGVVGVFDVVLYVIGGVVLCTNLSAGTDMLRPNSDVLMGNAGRTLRACGLLKEQIKKIRNNVFFA